MKKLIILFQILIISLTISTQEKINNLDRQAFEKMSNNEKYFLITTLISEYNKIVDIYNLRKLEYNDIINKYENEKKELTIKYEKLKKSIKLNSVNFSGGYGLNTKLENNLLLALQYNRLIFNVFSLGGGVSYNYNVNFIHTVYISLHASYHF